MNTSRNRAKVLAQFLRAAVSRIGARAVVADGSARMPENDYTTALVTIEQVAEELETVAATPDPDGARR